MSSSFCVILLINQPTNKQTGLKNITYLVELKRNLARGRAMIYSILHEAIDGKLFICRITLKYLLSFCSFQPWADSYYFWLFLLRVNTDVKITTSNCARGPFWYIYTNRHSTMLGCNSIDLISSIKFQKMFKDAQVTKKIVDSFPPNKPKIKNIEAVSYSLLIV